MKKNKAILIITFSIHNTSDASPVGTQNITIGTDLRQEVGFHFTRCVMR